MARLKDIVRGLGEQTTKRHSELQASTDELNKLREAARQFKELEAIAKEKQESLIIGVTLLLNVPQKVNPEANAYAEHLLEDDLKNDMYFSYPVETMNLDDIPLWKIIREILRQTSEMRVYELENHLASFSVKASRSAIESALATHKKEFRIEKHNREKFVSLK